MSDKPDLPLWSAAAARERRAGLRTVDPPPLQRAPERPKTPRKRRKPPAPSVATVASLPLARDRRLLSRLVYGAADTRRVVPGEVWLEAQYRHIRQNRTALGISPDAVDADINQLRNAVELHRRLVLDRGPDENCDGGDGVGANNALLGERGEGELDLPIFGKEAAALPRVKLAMDDLLTEDRVALEFARLNADKLRFCHDSGCWFKWTDSSWKPERTGLAFHLARKLSRSLAGGADRSERTVAAKTGFVAGVERFARTDRAFAVTIDNWDRDPYLLGTPTGTVDLRTGKLRRANPNDGISRETAVGPSEHPDCPLWLRFLDEITGGDAELIRFLQQYAGCCLTGDTREHALVFIYGPGGNGKSVFLNILTGLLNAYAVTAAMDTFTASAGDKHPTDLAMLRGARLVTASETEEGRAWAESRIKSMTGGDPISARFVRQDFFTFTPQFKLIIVGNHCPRLKNADDAARRRFNIVPFTRKPEKPDRDLETKLRAERPGILRWMIDGCLDWQRNGLVRPASVAAATADYFAEQDLFAQWLEDECDVEPGNAYKWETTAALFASWTGYAKAAGEHPGTVKAFAHALRRHGLTEKRTKQYRGWAGLRLNRDDSGTGDG